MDKNISLALGIVAAAMGSLPASAQSPEGARSTGKGALEEITVTARRIEESLQKTPISVSAFQGEDFEKLHLENVGDTAAYTPNFATIAGPTGQKDAFFFIRGIGIISFIYPSG